MSESPSPGSLAEEALEQRARLAAFVAAITTCLIRATNEREMADQCTKLMVDHLNVTFARIWILNKQEQVLELKASSGRYTNLDGSHSRIPVGGKLKVGIIARDGKPILTNDVCNDPHISDKDWARSEGIVSFAGYPLVSDNDVIGVMAMFAQHSLSDVILEALSLVADNIVLGLERLRAQDALRKMNEQLEIRVQERTGELLLLNKELAAARDDAQAASRLKSEFLANMSHEIRTPMNSIIGMANVLLKTDLNGQQDNYANAIRTAGHDLLKIINNILDFSKIEAGKTELNFSDFDLTRLIESTCELFATEACARQLPLMTFVDPSVPSRVRGDPERIQQILMNLIGNAFKFSSSGTIIVRAEVGSTACNSVTIKFYVADHGIGLTEEEQQRLFQPFVQADGSVSRKFGGTGLGLSICKRLLEMMGGRIGLASIKGQGSTFWFTVPLEPVSKTPCVSPNEELQGTRLLVVDGMPESSIIIETYTAGWGMRPSRARTAREALHLLRQANLDNDPFQVAVIGLTLPDGNGLELGRKMLSDESINKTSLILLSAFDSPGLGALAADAGFRAYLTKPVTQTRLFRNLLHITGGGTTITTGAARSTGVRKIPKHGRPILVVEDHIANQQVAQLYLDELGLASDVVDSGADALEAVARNKYALVLMDCQMPDLDGFAATQKVRGAERMTGEHLPIVAMTAHALEGDRERCLSAGMDDYISKPIDPDELRQVLEKWLPDIMTAAAPAADMRSAEATTLADLVAPADLESIRSAYQVHAANLFDSFLSDASMLIESIRTMIDRKDAVELTKYAHGLKGICGSISARQMLETCRELEAAGRHGDWTRAGILLDRLGAQLGEFRCARPAVEPHKSIKTAEPARELRILLVEDQQVTRLGARIALEGVPGLTIVGEASDGLEALDLIRNLRPDVVLMDIGLPLLNGIEAARKIKASQPEVRILMFTGHNHDGEVLGALAAGADGYCLKESPVEQTVTAIQAVSSGAAWLDPAIAKRVRAACARTDEQISKSSHPRQPLKSPLSDRELEILRLIVEGLSNKQIAAKLEVTLDTVKSHVKYVLWKLSVSDRTQAAVKALQEGLLEGDSGE